MLKFKGKRKELKEFLEYLMYQYGKNEKLINILKRGSQDVYL